MLKSMFSAVTGLRNHQTMLDVIGNNIANVNTAGFKSSRVVFSDVYYQTMSSSTAPGDVDVDSGAGGTNTSQIGYGSTVSSIDILNTRGGYQQSDKSTDLYIGGEGYFVVRGSTPADIKYTRVGNFSFDSAGSLVDANGNHVLGANNALLGDEPDIGDLENININLADYSNVAIGQNGVITGINNTTGATTTLGQIALATFANPDALSQDGSLYMSPTANSGSAAYSAAEGSSTGMLVTGGLEMSNVDLSKQFTDMIIAQRGFQANSRVITTSDEILQELVNLKR